MHIDTAAVIAREAVRTLGRSGLGPDEFLHEVSSRVRRVVPHDASGWMTLDPDTLLPGGPLETQKSPELVRALWRNELLVADVHKLAEIARRPTPIATLSQLDDAAAAGSQRIELIYRRVGIGDELRAMLRVGDTVWGHFVLYRELGLRNFGNDERAFLAHVAPEIADGLRRSLSKRPVARSGVLGPGVAVDADGTIKSATDEASRMMALMPGDVPSTMYALAVAASRDESARARIRLADGRWLVLHAGLLHGRAAATEPAPLAVTLMPAPPAEVASILLRVHGLSPREREVAKLLILGASTEDIAAGLHISLHTLRDHIKSIFAKVGANRRSELMALASIDE